MSTVDALPSAARIGLARGALELRCYVRDRQLLVFSFLYPMVMLAIFGSVFRHDEVAGGVSYVQYFVPGIAATGIMLGTFQALGVTIALERESGELARLRALATPVLAYVMGKAIQVVVSTAAQLVGVLLLARFAFGVPLPADGGRWLTFGWVGGLGAITGTALGAAVSLLPRSATSAASVIAPIALVAQFFSGVFFVFGTLPGWMRGVADVFPLRWLTLGLRSALLPDRAAAAETGGGWQHPTTAVVLMVWMLLGVAVCARCFRWRNRA